jgi:hypothetical protein
MGTSAHACPASLLLFAQPVAILKLYLLPGGILMRILHSKAVRNIVVLCTLVTYSFIKGNQKDVVFTRKKIAIPRLKNNNRSRSQAQQETPRITIWVHGTKSMSFISDFVHAVPHKGLQHISHLSSMYRIKSVIKNLAQTSPDQFPLEHFYAYGWSGKLCFKKRREEAIQLYKDIAHIRSRYHSQYGVFPHITLITHSHGGNVALNLAAVPDKDPALRIDVIALACPVQHETKYCIQDRIFNRFYSLYSPSDVMQIIDPQGLYLTSNNTRPHFELSERVFPDHTNLRQARLEINGKGVSHLGFIKKKTISALPAILNAMEQLEFSSSPQTYHEHILEVSIPEHSVTQTTIKRLTGIHDLLQRNTEKTS